MSSYSQKLIITCPSTLATKYTAIADLFLPTGNLQLITGSENYARIEEGDGSKFYDYYSGTSVTISPKRVGMNISVIDQRFEIRLALEELSALSLSTGYSNYVPVTIFDYVRPEWQDYAQGFTKRVGKIDGFDDGSKGGGASRKGYRLCNGTEVNDPAKGLFGGGFRFRFIELQQRLIS